MAFPYLFASNFDRGDASEWDIAESDTGSALDFPHYSELARLPGYPAPYQGAYVMRITDIADTNDHTIGDGNIDIADAATRWVRFALFISADFSATANDTFNIFEFQQADGTIEASLSLRITASTDAMEIGIGDGTEATNFVDISKGVWHVIEMRLLVSTGGAGTFDLWVDGENQVALASQTHAAAVGQGVLGTQGTLATTDVGFLLFDAFVFDDTRPAITQRWHCQKLVAADSFAFVGPGCVENLKVLDGGSNDVICELYDTDVYNASLTPVHIERTTVANTHVDSAAVPIHFQRGCLVKFVAGTAPGALITIKPHVAFGSDAAVKGYGARRRGSLNI